MDSKLLVGLPCLIGTALFSACGGASSTDLFDNGDASASSTSSSSSSTSSSSSSSSGGTDAAPPDGGSSGTVDSGPGACIPGKANACPAGAWCEPVSACSTTTGTCKLKPAVTNTPNPVCGCDNITYFNPTLAANANVGTRTSGECAQGTAVKCTDTKCPTGSVCNLGHPTIACSSVLVDETCWVIPNNCGQGDPKNYRLCEGGSGQCISACNALKNEKDFYTTTNCN